MNKLLKSAFSLTLALTLMFSLGTAAFAQEYDISLGSIEVNASGEQQTVTQEANGITNQVQDSPTVIFGQSDSNTVTITAAEGQTANVTLGKSGDSGNSLYIDVSDIEAAAISVEGNGTVNIELEGNTELRGGDGHAAIEKGEKGTLNINDSDGDGSLKAYGGNGGAAIGGGKDENTANINITGGKVKARGGIVYTTYPKTGEIEFISGAGIGGGAGGSADKIKISGGEVEAEGWSGAAGIGGGAYAKYDSDNNLTGSKSGGCQNVTISGNANVTATATGIYGIYDDDFKLVGAPIGKGANGTTPGEAVTPNTSKLASDGMVKLITKDLSGKGEGTVDTITSGASEPSSATSSATVAAPLSARYSVIKGNNQTWLTGSSDGLEFTLNSENVVKVLIDGEEVEFELNENGDIVISAEVLQALEAGEHEIKFVFADGSCKTEFTVK